MEKVYSCAGHLPRMDRADNDVGTIPWVYC